MTLAGGHCSLFPVYFHYRKLAKAKVLLSAISSFTNLNQKARNALSGRGLDFFLRFCIENRSIEISRINQCMGIFKLT